MDPTSLPLLPARAPAGHKGTFGTVCVLGGQASPPRVMIGGPALSALAALRAGAGLAVLAMPRPIMSAALVIAPSATGLALPVDGDRVLRPSEVAELLDAHRASFDCLAAGPGLGAGVAQQQIVVRLVGQDDLPLVLDADALNALAAAPDFPRDLRAPTVMTPHPGEFRRLAEALDLDADPVDPEARPEAARLLAARLGCVVVLKGPGTIVTDGIETVVNDTGNAALATAGTGDVLTGLIAGLIAQFFRPCLGAGSRQVSAPDQGGLGLLECAALAVRGHGIAADLWAARRGPAGLTAIELCDLLPEALAPLRAGSPRGGS